MYLFLWLNQSGAHCLSIVGRQLVHISERLLWEVPLYVTLYNYYLDFFLHIHTCMHTIEYHKAGL